MNPTTTVRFVAPWTNILSLALLFLVPPLWGGCSTVFTRNIDLNEDTLRYDHSLNDEPATVPRIYSGTFLDLGILASWFRGKGSSDSAVLFVDLPFSLAADTVLLPLTAYEQIRYGNFGDDAPPLVLAARDGDVAKVRGLVEQGTAVDVKTKGGLTALMMAASNGATTIIQLLLDRGADPHAKDTYGKTALWHGEHHRANTEETAAIRAVELLKRAGAKE